MMKKNVKFIRKTVLKNLSNNEYIAKEKKITTFTGLHRVSLLSLLNTDFIDLKEINLRLYMDNKEAVMLFGNDKINKNFDTVILDIKSILC